MCSDSCRSAAFSCGTTGSWVYSYLCSFMTDSKQMQMQMLSNQNSICIILTSLLPASSENLTCVLSPPSSPCSLAPLFSFPPCFHVAAVFGPCLRFLSTSDLQMSCMLRSWSTRPLARSWTMPSMTWRLCRCSLASPSLSCLSIFSLWIICAFFTSYCADSNKLKISSFLLHCFFVSLLSIKSCIK